MSEEGKGASKLFVGGCVVFVLLGLLSCCGGGLLFTFVGPSLLLKMVIADEPLDVQVVRWDPARVDQLRERLAADLEEKHEVQLTGDELTQLVLSAEEAQLAAFRIDVDDQDRVVLDLSWQPNPAEPQYFNIHLLGDMTVEDGWFTALTVDELELGSLDLGQHLAGQDLTDDANQNLSQQRLQDPELAETLDTIERLEIEDGRFTLVLDEEGVERLKERDAAVAPGGGRPPVPGAPPGMQEAADRIKQEKTEKAGGDSSLPYHPPDYVAPP